MKQTQQKCGICLSFYSTRVRNHCPLCGAYKFVESGRIRWRTWNPQSQKFVPIARVFPFPVSGLLDRLIALANRVLVKTEKEIKRAKRLERKHGLRSLQDDRERRKQNVETAKANGEVFLPL